MGVVPSNMVTSQARKNLQDKIDAEVAGESPPAEAPVKKAAPAKRAAKRAAPVKQQAAPKAKRQATKKVAAPKAAAPKAAPVPKVARQRSSSRRR